MKHLRNAAILLGLAAYAIAFYATPLASVASPAGKPPPRGDVVFVLFFRPYENLFSNWFGSPAQFTLSDRIPVLLSAVFILVWAAVLGWLPLAVCRATRGLTRLETAVFSTAVGLNLLSTWMLAVGLAGQLGRLRAVVAPALLSFAAAAGLWYWRWRARHKENSRGPPAPGEFDNVENLLAAAAVQHAAEAAVQPPPQQRAQLSPQQRARLAQQRGAPLPPQRAAALAAAYRRYSRLVGRRWLLLALPFVAAILLAAILPPADFDVCEYHMQAPKEFFQQGKIGFLPHNVYANMALGVEMLSLLAMRIMGDWWWGALAGKTVIAAFTPLCALALFAAGRRFYSTAAGVVAALVYISIPWVISVSSIGMVEGASACYLFLALYAVLLSRRQKAAAPLPHQQETHRTNPAALVALAGYLAGAAVATKYPAVVFVLIPLALWAFAAHFGPKESGENHEPAEANPPPGPSAVPTSATPPFLSHEPRPLNPLFALTVFLLAAVLGCGLWFAKNWALTRNPTYPLLCAVFDGGTWTAEKDRRWNQAHLPHDFSAETLGHDLGRVALTSEWLSPLVVPLAVLAFLGWGNKPAVAWRRLRWELLAYAGFVVAAWWLLTHRIDRFWIPVLPVLALLAGAGACWGSERWWRRVLKIVLLAGLAANFVVSSAGWVNAWFVPLDDLRNDTPNWISPCHRYLNYENVGGGTILTVGDAAVFDLKPPVLYNTCFDDCVFEQLVRDKASKETRPEDQLRSAREIRADFASLHIAYVVVNWSEIDRYRRTYGFTHFVKPEVFERLVKQGILELMPQVVESAKQIYRVKP